MTPETKEALEKCIEKYDRASEGEKIKIGSKSCALCNLFISKDCAGCPVRTKTGKEYCIGSPYHEIELACSNHYEPIEKYKDAARRERDFLISLRED